MPQKFQIPVVWGTVDRAQHALANPSDTPTQHLIDCYAVACMHCFLQMEWYMRNGTLRQEVASVMIEQNNELQKRLI
jgi:hypothetical protein